MSSIFSASLTALLGREQETATLSQLLKRADVRLVTISGPGGVGKTSLALQVAHELQDVFPDGVFFVSLAAITDSTLIIPTIAQTLGVTESPNRLLFDSLKDFLRKKQTLLLLDNFEQIISAAPLLTELLNDCAELHVLVTSRESLRLRGEHEFPLAPLELDDHAIKSEDRSANTLMQSPAIALFIQRVQAVQPDFHLTEENASDITEICTHLDGLPLAIELAAARIKLLPPKTILEKLQESSLQLLTSGARDMPARQQTLRNAIQWSYDLLEDDEKRTFRWLAIFIGGCTLEAAQSVIGTPASMDVLDSLVSKSLIRQTEVDGTPRLAMLETIREFGLEQLSHTNELFSARHAHTTYYLTFTGDAELQLTGADQKIWLRRLDRDQDNLRAVLRWAVEHNEGELAQQMAGALQPFWLARGYWSEGRRWLEESLELSAAQDQAVQAKALYGAGVLIRFQGDFARARMLCEQGLTSYRALEDKAGTLKSLVQLYRIADFQNDQTAAKAFLAEANTLIETLSDSIIKANAYTEMVISMEGTGAYLSPDKAAHYLNESERIHRALDNQAGLAFTLIHQATLAVSKGDYEFATSRFDEAERMAMELEDKRLLSRLAMSRLLLNIQERKLETSRLQLEEILQSAIIRGDHHAPSGLPIFAIILHEQGLDVWAARVFGLADELRATDQLSAWAATLDKRFHTNDVRAKVRIRLGDDAFDREVKAGHQITMEDLLKIPHPKAPTPDQINAPSGRGAALTPRELEVLDLLAEELSNPQIAEQLVVSRRTVDAHLRSIYDKLSVKSRGAAIRVAKERGWIENRQPK